MINRRSFGIQFNSKIGRFIEPILVTYAKQTTIGGHEARSQKARSPTMRKAEGLLRKPFELVPATVCIVGAVTVATMPNVFLINDGIETLVCSALLATLGIWRLTQGISVVRYLLRIKSRKSLGMNPADLPVDAERLYIGEGFLWQPQHSQRLADIRRTPKSAKQTVLSRFADKSMSNAHRIRKGNDVVAAASGGDHFIHGIGEENKPVWIDATERAGHMLVLGTTRTGKTRLAELLVAQDIRRGDTVVVLDPKGDTDLLRRMIGEVRRCGREKEFMMLHLGFPEISARYNPVGSFSRVTEVATRVAAQLPGDGQSAAFRSFAWRYVNIAACATVALGARPSFEILRRAAEDIDPLVARYYEKWLDDNVPNWREPFAEYERRLLNRRDTYVTMPWEMKSRDPKAAALVLFARQCKDKPRDDVARGLESVMRHERNHYDKLIASLLPFLEKMTSGDLGNLLSPKRKEDSAAQSTLEWRKIFREGGVVYVGLDSLADAEVGKAVGYAMFSDIKSTAAKIYRQGKPPPAPISIHADEMGEIAGGEATGLLNKGGGAGIRFTAYAQTRQDLDANIGRKAAADQQLGNLNSLVMFRVKNQETAELLTERIAEVETHTVAPSSAANDSETGFSSRSEDKVSVSRSSALAPGDLMGLPRGDAFVLTDGGALHKIKIPLIKDDNLMPGNMEDVSEWVKKQQSPSSRENKP